MSTNEKEQMQENLFFIKEGVQECYDDVRALLLNFHTKISKKELPETEQSLVKRFKQPTQVSVTID